MESRSTLQLYRHKIGIGDEGIHCNRYGSVLLFQFRTNTLRLGWRQCFVGGAVECLIYGVGEETVAHFVTDCEALDGVRRRFGVGRRWRGPRRCWRRCMEQELRRWKNKWIDLRSSSADAAKGCR